MFQTSSLAVFWEFKKVPLGRRRVEAAGFEQTPVVDVFFLCGVKTICRIVLGDGVHHIEQLHPHKLVVGNIKVRCVWWIYVVRWDGVTW